MAPRARDRSRHLSASPTRNEKGERSGASRRTAKEEKQGHPPRADALQMPRWPHNLLARAPSPRTDRPNGGHAREVSHRISGSSPLTPVNECGTRTQHPCTNAFPSFICQSGGRTAAPRPPRSRIRRHRACCPRFLEFGVSRCGVVCACGCAVAAGFRQNRRISGGEGRVAFLGVHKKGGARRPRRLMTLTSTLDCLTRSRARPTGRCGWNSPARP